MSISAHHAAVRARIEAHPKLSGKVDDVARVKTNGEYARANYVVLGVTTPGLVEDRLTNVPGPDADGELTVHARVVAVDVAGVNLLTDALLEQLQGHLLTVPSRAVTPLNGEVEDIDYDRAANLFHRDVWFEATTSRA